MSRKIYILLKKRKRKLSEQQTNVRKYDPALQKAAGGS